MTVDLNNFLHSLARDLAAGLSLVYVPSPATQKRDLFRNVPVEDDANDPYSSLKIYGGPGTDFQVLPEASIQIMTIGTDPDAALSRAQRLFEGLTNSEGRPRSMATINGYKAADDTADGHWMIVGVRFLQRPGLIGTDARKRHQAVFNVEVRFFKKD